MRNEDKANGNPTMPSYPVRRNRAGFSMTQSNTGEMRQQGQDWSRGHACVPQSFVRLVGYRDPDARPSSPLPQRPMRPQRKSSSSDTPIG